MSVEGDFNRDSAFPRVAQTPSAMHCIGHENHSVEGFCFLHRSRRIIPALGSYHFREISGVESQTSLEAFHLGDTMSVEFLRLIKSEYGLIE